MLSLGTPMVDIMIAGRWLTERSCREYLRRGEVMLTRLNSQVAAETWERIAKLAAAGEVEWDL